MAMAEGSQEASNFLNLPLRLPVCLRVISRRQTYGLHQEFEEILPYTGNKLRTPVGYNILRNSEIPEDMIEHDSAVTIAVGRFLRGIKRQDLENRSTITRIHVLPFEAGKSVTMSTPRCDHGRLGTGSGRKFACWKMARALGYGTFLATLDEPSHNP